MLSMIVIASLAFNFLFELTSMSPKARFKVFRVELTKVFMTVVFFYLIGLIFTWWIRGCGSAVKRTISWKELKLRQQRDLYARDRVILLQRGYKESSIVQFKVQEILTESETTIRKFETHGLHKMTIVEVIDYSMASLEKLMDDNCAHISERDTKEALVYVQNLSAVSFFLLVQLPLSRVSAVCTFATGFLVWFIDT